MNTNEIYIKLSENIIHQLKSFKKREINPRTLNENLILNLSSMCKFLKGKETLSNPNLDVYLPMSRFENKLNDKIRGKDLTVEDSKNENLQRKSTENEFKNKENDENIFFNKHSIVDFDNTSHFGINLENFYEGQIEMNQSIISKSLLNKDQISMRDDDISFSTDLLDKSEISTIYKGNSKKDMFDESVVNISIFNDQSYINFQKKIKSSSSNELINCNVGTNTSEELRKSGTNNEKPRNSNIIENETFLENDSSSMVNLNNLSKNNSSISSLVKQVIDEINGELKEKAVREFIKEMNAEYIRSMYSIYAQIRDACNKNKECENLIFINKFKSFVLEIGISDKKFYEQCIREIIYNKNNLKFLEFLLCFHKLIYLKFDQNFLKYKFLFHITKKKNDEYMESNDIEKFFELLKAKKIYEPETYKNITTKMVDKYKEIFPFDGKLYVRKLALVLEQFFDLK